MSHFGAVYRPLDNKTANAFVAEQREQYGCQMFPKYASINKLSQFIRSGGILGILADQRSGKVKNARPFFGENSARSKLPAVLQKRTQAPLYSLSVYSEKDAHWTITIAEVHQDSSIDSEIEHTLTQITRAYEHAFSQNILDVFWLHRYWK